MKPIVIPLGYISDRFFRISRTSVSKAISVECPTHQFFNHAGSLGSLAGCDKSPSYSYSLLKVLYTLATRPAERQQSTLLAYYEMMIEYLPNALFL